MHPATLSESDLLRDCQWSTQRRGGPGGQHRNKVETAVILRHTPSGVVAEANERRSQAENRRVAIFRLRLLLALQVRSTSELLAPSAGWQASVVNQRLLMAATNPAFPSLLAELFDFLATCDWALAPAASHFDVSASQLLKLLRKYPPALERLNQQRQLLGLKPLK